MTALFSRLFIGILYLFSWLPWKVIYVCSSIFKFLLYNIVGYRKKVVMNNLRNSFPEKTPTELENICSSFYSNLCDIFVETLKLQTATAAQVLERVEHDATLSNRLFAEKKDGIIVAGHTGNWEWINVWSSIFFKQKTVAIYHPLHNATFEKWVYNFRTRFGTNMIPMREAYAFAKHPHNEPYFYYFANDQAPRPDKAYWTTFLNQDTGIFRGAENIARMLDIPVIYAEVHRNEKRRGHYTLNFTLICESPNKLPENGILETQINLLEKDIRNQPANWLWSHRRWKHKKPTPTIDN